MSRTRAVRVAAVAVLALLSSSCFGRGADPNVLLVAKIAGAVQSRVTGGDWQDVSQGQRLASGDRLRVAPGGTVVLERGDQSLVEIRPNDTAPAELLVDSIELINVFSGDALISSRKAAPIAVESGGIQARGEDSVFRFDRRLSVRVGVYEGAATVAAAGGTLPVPALREGIVSARLLPRGTRPLALNPGDPWDVRFLGDIIELNGELAAQHRGYEAEFGRRATVASLERYFRSGLGLGSLSFVRPFLSSASHGDVLTGLVLTSLVINRDGGQSASIFEQLMTLLDQGASWGLIVRSLGIDGAVLLDGFVRAVGLRTGEVTPSPGIIGRSGNGGGGGGSGNGGGGGGGGGGSPSPTPTRRGSPSPTPSPPRSPTPSPSPSPSPSESPSPTPSPTCILPPPLCSSDGLL